MQFTKLSLAAAAISGASAVLNITDSNLMADLEVGKAFDITYGDASGSVTLILKSGDPNNLDTVSTLTAGLPAPSGSYSFTPSSDLPADNYAIEIVDSVTTNYGQLFQLQGATFTATSTGSASESITTTVASTSLSTTVSSTASTTASTTGSSSTGSSSTGSSTGTSTSASKTSSSAKSSTTSSAASTSTSAAAINGAGQVSSPLAMILGSFAAFVFLN